MEAERLERMHRVNSNGRMRSSVIDDESNGSPLFCRYVVTHNYLCFKRRSYHSKQ